MAAAPEGTRRDSGPLSPESVTVTPPGSAASFVVRIWPASDPSAPAVLILPAMAVKAKYYQALAAALNACGLSVATTDLRAQGESTPAFAAAPDFGYREMLDEDLPALAGAVRDRFPGAPLFLFGHSLGGQLALLFTSSAAAEVAGVIVIGTGSVYWRSFPLARQIPVLLGGQYIGLVTRLRGHWPGGKTMGGPVAGGVMTDWARHSRTGRYQPRGATRDYDRLLGELAVPVLAISFDADPLGPKATVDWLTSRLTSAKVTRMHLDEGSGLRNRGHFSWVRDADLLSPRIVGWVRDAAPLST